MRIYCIKIEGWNVNSYFDLDPQPSNIHNNIDNETNQWEAYASYEVEQDRDTIVDQFPHADTWEEEDKTKGFDTPPWYHNLS
jgi:hypothetical protein